MPQISTALSAEDAIAFCCEAIWGFAEVDPNGVFLWVNQAYADVLNAHPVQVVGSTWMQWTHPEDLEIDQELAGKVKSGELPGYTLAKRYIQRGGTPKNPRVLWGLLSVAGKWDKNGKFVGYRVQFRPYSNTQSSAAVDWKKVLPWIVENWRTIATIAAISISLMWGSSERFLDALGEAQRMKNSVDSVLQPSSHGPSLPPESTSLP